MNNFIASLLLFSATQADAVLMQQDRGKVTVMGGTAVAPGIADAPGDAAAQVARDKVNVVAMQSSETVAGEEKADGTALRTLCRYMSQTFEQKAEARSVTVSAQWASLGCDLPASLKVAGPEETPDLTLTVCTDVNNVDTMWATLPAGGVMDVIIKEQSQMDEDFLWQVLYKVNSKLYFESYTGMAVAALGLEGLNHAAFFPGHVVLQKENDSTDLKEANGPFMTLASSTSTDKIDPSHNYQLLYHRTLDSWPSTRQGMLLEIGLGCTMNYGAGASAKIWPELIPHLDTHFIELNGECTKRWLPAMMKDNVKKVHVGSQADPAVLADVTKDKQAEAGGLQVVIDDGSHECHHIEASFRYLFPQVAPQGFYFVEDMMYSSWGTAYRQSIKSKNQRTKGTPIALAAVLAAAATGAASPVSYPADKWSESILASYGQLLDFMECTPGICAYQRK